MILIESNKSPSKINLIDLSLSELNDLVEGLGEKPFRARQLASWIFRKGIDDFNQMSDISASFKRRLEAQTTAKQCLKVLELARDQDGSIKILWELFDGNKIESVILQEREHLTLCLSTQVGCRMGCLFCRTGAMGLIRNLTQGEILSQFIMSPSLLGVSKLKLTNVVYMGMGEPLDNLSNVLKSLEIFTDPAYMALSPRHISLSTVGLVPQIEEIAEKGNLKAGLTVSLGSATDDLRSYLMPINRAYSLSQLKKALADFPLQGGRRITVAYVVIKGVNDCLDHARAFSRFLGGLKVKVNLIAFNPWPGAPFDRPSEETVQAFKKVLVEKFHTVIVRRSKGLSVNAACGQLAAQRAEPSPSV
ncbi:MAG: 23S rRNA (adenine(2503)-C(2))-methyltransferase RlmN [Deltaproteobacteria bacterium]|jgi:23S rRNA (adenine2503-C2)-methyltransferase|nr:23S rRNA (adenine(2503)-C(2))-methyltransferase RlmN [Deltaproteobacteria bacterium]